MFQHKLFDIFLLGNDTLVPIDEKSNFYDVLLAHLERNLLVTVHNLQNHWKVFGIRGFEK
jgi:hypothetical protein